MKNMQVGPMDFAVAVIAANEGRIVGKTRLQKTVYLLQKLCKTDAYSFEYHYFGPYSAELANDIDMASSVAVVKTSEKYGYYSMPYVVYETEESNATPVFGDNLASVKKWLHDLESVNAIELELAATWIFLKDEEGMGRTEIEEALRSLKPTKASKDGLRQASSVLRRIGLAV
jgi:uncharacterized protein YwgA